MESDPTPHPAARRSPGIRRLDWRFLLPPAEGGSAGLSLVGATGRIMEAAGSLGLLARGAGFDRPRAPVPPTVAAVLVTGAPSSPDIRPGALSATDSPLGSLADADVVWWEVNRLTRDGFALPPSRLLRRLTGAGFDSGVVYWAKGGHDRCTMYLPLEGGRAVRWYFGSALQAPAPIRWALSAGTRFLAALGPRTIGALLPAYGVVAWRGGEARGAPAPAMIAEGTRAGALGPVAESALLLYGEGDWSRVVHVPFPPGAATPVAAVKHPRTPRFNEETARERATLLDLRARLGEMRDTVPRPTHTFEKDGLRVVVEEWVDGRPMVGGRRGHAKGRAARENLRVAAEWLCRLHARTADGPAPVANHIPALVDAPAAAYLDRVGGTAEERALLERFRGTVESLGHLHLPRVIEHRDFGPWNIYRARRGIVVIDWEVAEWGFPLCDLLYFGMHWRWITGRVASREDEVRSLRRLVSPASGDELADAFRIELNRYLSESRLDTALVPVLLVHLLLRQAVDLVTRREAGSEPATDPGNRYADYVRALAPHADELFRSPAVLPGRST